MTFIQRSSTGITASRDNLNPILQVVTWVLLALTCLMMAFRFLTRFFLKANRRFGIEDVLIVCAWLFALGQFITVIIPPAHILGTTVSELTRAELITGVKVLYAGELLLILSLTLAKISVCAGFLDMTVDENHRRVTYLLGALSILWGLSSLFGNAFRCGSHGTWEQDTASCVNEIAFQRYVMVVNIITDLSLVFLPTWIILPLTMPLKTRIMIIGFFSSRLLVVATSVLELIYLSTLNSRDFTRDAFAYFLTKQFMQFTAVASACIAYFWPFLRSLRSGLMWSSTTTFTTQHTLSKISTQQRQADQGNKDVSGQRRLTEVREASL